MFGFNFIDAGIILLLVGAIAAGIKLGVVNQLFVLSGFFGALFLAGALFPHLIPLHDRTIRTIINANLVLLAAFYAAARCFDLSQRLHWSFLSRSKKVRHRWQSVDTLLGVGTAAAACLIIVWLVATAIERLPFAAFSNSTSDARIVQLLTTHLPPVPAVFAEFDRQVNPNSQPYLFVTPKPQASFDYSAADVQAATAKATGAIVRLTGFGCGGLLSGTGFAPAPHLIITNAHVIAGVRRPIVKYNGQSYVGVPVLFNPNLDIAVLRVEDLTTRTVLALDHKDTTAGTSGAVVGYPGGNYRAAPGLIRNDFVVYGRNIYDTGVVGRDIYEVQASVSPGSSGGPLVLSNGEVAGVIFAKSNTVPNDAFALTSSRLIASVNKAARSYRSVSTGACLAR